MAVRPPVRAASVAKGRRTHTWSLQRRGAGWVGRLYDASLSLGAATDQLAARGPGVRVGSLVHTWPMPWTAGAPLSATLLDLQAMQRSTLALSEVAPSALAPLLPRANHEVRPSTVFAELATLRGWDDGAAPLHAPVAPGPSPSELERALRRHTHASDVVHEWLRQQHPAYVRSCRVTKGPAVLARSFPTWLWPAYDARGYLRAASAPNEAEVRVEACGTLARLQTTSASAQYLEGVRASFAAAAHREPAWRDMAAGIESSDAVRETLHTLQTLVDNYTDDV